MGNRDMMRNLSWIYVLRRSDGSVLRGDRNSFKIDDEPLSYRSSNPSLAGVGKAYK